jgi:hypothetical protein
MERADFWMPGIAAKLSALEKKVCHFPIPSRDDIPAGNGKIINFFTVFNLISRAATQNNAT